MNVSHAFANASGWNSPASSTNFIRLSDARLHAESSRNMYSEQGLLALMRAVFGQVCQSLIVVSYCMPGSPQAHVASVIIFMMSRALKVSNDLPVLTSRVCHSPSST